MAKNDTQAGKAKATYTVLSPLSIVPGEIVPPDETVELTEAEAKALPPGTVELAKTAG